MEANLAANGPERRFPPSNWGPGAAVLGVILAIGAGVMLGIPALIIGQDQGAIERFEPPRYERTGSFDDADSTALAVDPDDGILYANHDGEVLVFPPGAREPASASRLVPESADLALDPRGGRLFVADTENDRIEAFETRGGSEPEPVGTVEGPSFEAGALAFSDAAGSPGGSLYAVDPGADEVLRIGLPDGAAERLRPAADGAPFEFGGDSDSTAIAVDPGPGPGAGNVYVAAGKSGEGTVWAFAADGAPLWEMPFEDSRPCGLAVDPGGQLWVGESDGDLVQYARAGDDAAPRPTGLTASADLAACELAFEPGGELLVAREADQALTTLGSVLAQLGTALGFLLVPMAIASWRGAASLREILRRLGFARFSPWTATKGIAAAIGAYLVFASLYSVLIVTPEQEDIAESFGPIWVQVGLIVVAASVAEEVCFRGFLFGGLREKLPSWAAALIAATIFGGLHALTGITAVPPLIFFGFVLCLLYERTGSIVPGILLHMLNNSVALLAQ